MVVREMELELPVNQKKQESPVTTGIKWGTNTADKAYSNQQLIDYLREQDIELKTKSGTPIVSGQQVYKLLRIRYHERCDAPSYTEAILKMSMQAAERALVGEDRDKINVVAAVTSYPDYFDPTRPPKNNFAETLKDKLKLNGVQTAKDFSAACSGGIYGFNELKKLEDSLWGKRILLMIAEDYPDKITDPFNHLNFSAKALCVIFTYGYDIRILKSIVAPEITDPDQQNIIKMERDPDFPYLIDVPHTDKGFEMEDGHAVQRFIEKELPLMIEAIMKEHSWTDFSQVKRAITPQPNGRAPLALARWASKKYSRPDLIYYSPGVPNFAACSTLFNYKRAYESGVVRPGDTVLASGIGAGPGWAIVSIKHLTEEERGIRTD